MSNKKTKKKHTKLKKTAAKKGKLVKKTVRDKLAKKKAAPKKPALKKVAVKTKALGKKTTGAKTAGTLKKRVREKSRSVDTEPFAREGPRARSGGQSGDLQGLSNVEGADSESVDELLEEGNAFEADVVTGVERAGTSEKEIRTHEVPEDDVPGEYLDKE
jgi:hypothetical protein